MFFQVTTTFWNIDNCWVSLGWSKNSIVWWCYNGWCCNVAGLCCVISIRWSRGWGRAWGRGWSRGWGRPTSTFSSTTTTTSVPSDHVDDPAGAEKFRYIHQVTWPTSPGCKYWHPAPLHRNASKPSHPGEQEYGQLPVHLDEQSYFASPTTTCERSAGKIAPRRIKEGNMCSI